MSFVKTPKGAPGARALAIFTAFLVAVLLAAPGCGGAATDASLPDRHAASPEALAETLNTTPTGWAWYYDQTPADLSSLVSSNNARIVSLQVQQPSPLLFTVAMVTNTGSYGKAWWYYYGVTAAQLSANMNTLNARPVSLDAYVVNGVTYFAAVLISNTGADAKGYSWYYGQTAAQVGTLVSQNNARLVDFRSYATANGTRYVVVMIPNTGADAMAWWYYYGQTAAQVGNLLQQNNAFLTSIQPADAGGNTFNVVMQQQYGFGWWWYYGLTASELGNAAAQNGARLIDVKSYVSGGTRKFAAVMVNNSNAATTRVGNILRAGTDGATGLYLKQMNGPVLASLQADRIFEPASTIKILIGLHVFQQIDLGNASVSDNIVKYAPPASGSCPTGTAIGTDMLGFAVNLMLENSDNDRTRAIVDTFAANPASPFAEVNQTGAALGLTGTQLRHYPGCGANPGTPSNQLTLADAGKIYEGIANGSLISSTNRPDLYARMPTQAGDFTGVQSAVNAIIDQEAAAIGLTAAEISQFKSRILTHYKGGGYNICTAVQCLNYLSVAGVAEIPQCGFRNTVTNKNYMWGIFIDGATNQANAGVAFNNAKAEPLREPIRAALANWSPCF